MKSRVRETVNRFPVGREQQQTGRHDIESSDIGQRCRIGNEVEDGAPALFILRRCHHAQWLVKREPTPRP
jgi:hypothetical protein